MTRLQLFDFQQEAAEKLLNACITYFEIGQDRFQGRDIPFIGQLKAVTGAGKTPILASILGRISHSLVLWTTKYGGVVQQTTNNLKPGGKYFHLLGEDVEVFNFSEIKSVDHWRRILEKQTGLTILVSTVAAWNSSEKDERLNVHRISADWGDKSRWDQLKFDRNRRLWVVYDEAHNQTDEQVEQLDALSPAGFFIASASPVKGTLHQYLTMLSSEARGKRVIPVSTKAVVDAQLLKSTLSIADYDSPADEMITEAAQKRAELAVLLADENFPITPKAIYVVESSNTLRDDGGPRPVAIWKTLVNQCGVKPDNIAICTNTRTKDIPQGAILVKSIDQLSDQHLHIIFNKKLQEGWDDPSVYVAYFDGKTDSATRIQQVVGRALRQPSSRHFINEELNTAYFFINCPNEVLERIIDQLKEELRIYKDESDSDAFEPVRIIETKKALGKIPVLSNYVGQLKVPQLMLEMPSIDGLYKLIERGTYEFGDADLASPGHAIVRAVSVKTGDVKQIDRDLLEDMKVKCGLFLQQQIQILSKNCIHSIHPDKFIASKLQKEACYKSKALIHYHELAEKVVHLYESQVILTQEADTDNQYYTVKPYQPSGTIQKPFEHAAHPYYDSKSFSSDDELDMARALDKFDEYVWVRNKDRTDYGIPLPFKSGSSSTFYPDFLWWVGNTVWAIDPTGSYILKEKLRTKLLTVPSPLKIALATRGHLDQNFNPGGQSGWSLVMHRIGGNIVPQLFDTAEELLLALVVASD